MKSCLFIINPSSGQRIVQQQLDILIGKLVLQQIINIADVFYTKEKNDAYYKVFSVSDEAYDFFVAVGGDGTIHEVINGMVASKKTTPVALLAAGTVNDFANFLQLPTKVNDICEMLSQFHVIESDVGKMNDSYFINVAAGGMFSDVSFVVSKEDKKRFGRFAYYVNGIVNLPSQLRTNIPLRIVVDQQEVIEEDSMMFIVSNSNRVAGFNKITPYANVQDGLLDLLLIKKCSVTDLVSVFKDYKLDKHISSPFIVYRQARQIEISCQNQDVVIDIDGEKGTTLPVIITTIEKAIRFIVPSKKDT